jgi:hypothetical protein
MLDSGLRGQQVDLGKFEMKPANFVLAPDRSVKPVMGNRRQHEEPGIGRVIEAYAKPRLLQFIPQIL